MIKLVEIGFRKPKDPFMHDNPMPQTGDIVQYADREGQVLDTPLYLKRANFLRVMFDGRERAKQVNADRLTVITPYKPL